MPKPTPKTRKNKFQTEHCDNGMTFQECELAILRHAVDEAEQVQGQKMANAEDIKKILKIVEDFIIRKRLVCYGGTAINNILPKYDQFYNKDVEIPDYDFFSPNALDDAKELADVYYEQGYVDVEAKAGMHQGTFKVFVNFFPIADITYMQPELYDAIYKESLVILGIHYAPPNYLRMAMYLELSRPAGDVSRWEKVMKRLNLLNKNHPLLEKDTCKPIDFKKADPTSEESRLYFLLRDSFIAQEVIFFGGYAISLYSKYGNPPTTLHKNIPQFDVLSEEPERCAELIKESLAHAAFKNIKIIKHDAIGEIIPRHMELRVGKNSVAMIYEPIACHNYNTISIDGQEIHIATIDTILAFYLSFIYVDQPHYDHNRLLCMAQFLFQLEQQNRLQQRGVLKRFSLDCYGKQPTLEDIRAEKAQKFKELSRGTREYEMWFLRYVPDRVNQGLPSVSPAPEKKKRARRTRKVLPKTSGFLF